MWRKPPGFLVGTLLLTLVFAFACSGVSSSPAPSAPGPIAGKSPSAPPSAQASWEKRWNDLLAAATKEGEVLVYNPLTPDTTRPLAEAFKNKHGIQLNYVIGRGPEVAERIFAERNAGIFVGDVIIQGTNVQNTVLKPRGVLQVLDGVFVLPEINDPKSWSGGRIPWVDKDHTSLAFLANFSRSLTRNTELVQKDELKSWKDVLNPKWKGKIVLNDPTVTGPASSWFTFIMLKAFGSRERGIEYAQQLIKQEPFVTRDSRLQVEGLARGKFSLAIAATTRLITDFKKAGAPIEDMILEEGSTTSAGPGALSLLARPAHPNAAIVFANWVLTKEPQAIFVQGYGAPSARADVAPLGVDPMNVPRPGDKVYLQDEEFDLMNPEMIELAKKIFASLLK